MPESPVKSFHKKMVIPLMLRGIRICTKNIFWARLKQNYLCEDRRAELVGSI